MIRRAVNATSTSIRDALLVDGRKSETETESGYCEVQIVCVCVYEQSGEDVDEGGRSYEVGFVKRCGIS